jgi:hypothetical protein
MTVSTVRTADTALASSSTSTATGDNTL